MLLRNFSHVPESEISSITTDYAGGMGVSSLSKKYHRNSGCIRAIIASSGLPKNLARLGNQNGRSVRWDFDFFNRKDSTTSYWAGLLMADGSISKGETTDRLSLTLHFSDRSHLEVFCQALKASSSLISSRLKFDNTLQIRLNKKYLSQELIKWGIVPNKTYDFIEPDIPRDILPHYLRGWFDGDGNISLYQGKERFRITGNPLALKWYVQALRQIGYTGGCTLHHPDGEKWAKLDISGLNQLRQIVKLLFAPNPCLLRKWTPVLEYLEKNKEIRCPVCDKLLDQSSKSGYCSKHNEQSPYRLSLTRKYYGAPLQYCEECGKELGRNNRAGYCVAHRELSPKRKQKRHNTYVNRKSNHSS